MTGLHGGDVMTQRGDVELLLLIGLETESTWRCDERRTPADDWRQPAK